VYAHSSGAGLALHAAADLPIAKLVLHEPTYVPDGEEERRISREYAENLKVIMSEGRRGDAIELCMTTMGMPLEAVEGMRHSPAWAGLEAMAPTLAYDSEIMGDSSTGGTVPTDLLGRVTTESLVLCGVLSDGFLASSVVAKELGRFFVGAELERGFAELAAVGVGAGPEGKGNYRQGPAPVTTLPGGDESTMNQR
jgi:pimeloyl-ACP methyl ester carboxylesterase